MAWGPVNVIARMLGATKDKAGKGGIVPDPPAGANSKYLRGDGTWQTPPDTNTTYGAATQSAPGLMSAADKKKLDGVAAGANAYAHPGGSGNKHIPSGGASGQILRWSADGTAAWGADNDTKPTNMKGATASAAGAAGYAPAPAAGAANRYLRSDGTWAVPPDNNTTYGAATQSAPGLMSAADKKKLDGVAAGANAYAHPGGSGNKHIPSGGASGQILRWSADGTAVWGADNDTKPVNMKGATASAAGAAGYAPAPSAGAANRYLRSDGTWAVPPDNNTTYGAATQSAAGLMSAADKKKLDGVAAGANAYTHPAAHAASMITQDATHRFVSDTEKSTWNGKIDKSSIVQNATTNATDKVPSAAVAKNLQDQIDTQNTKTSGLTIKRNAAAGLTIDGTSYDGNTDVCYIEIKSGNRILALGHVCGGDSPYLWDKYIRQPRLIMCIITETANTGWVSIRGGLDN